jgi:hypothetical protein
MNYSVDKWTRNGEFLGVSLLLIRNTNKKLNFTSVRAEFI